MRVIGPLLCLLFVISAIYSLITGLAPFWLPLGQGLGDLAMFTLKNGWWLVGTSALIAIVFTLKAMQKDPPICYRNPGYVPPSQAWPHRCSKCGAPNDKPAISDKCARCDRRYDHL